MSGSVGDTKVKDDGAVLSIVNILVAVCVFPAESFAVIVTEYVPSAIVELVKFQLLYEPVFEPKIELFIVIEPTLGSAAVPRIETVETERFAFAAGLVIESVGAVVSIFIVCEVNVSRLPAVSLDLNLMYEVPSVDIETVELYTVLGEHVFTVSVQYIVLSQDVPPPGAHDSVTVTDKALVNVLNV